MRIRADSVCCLSEACCGAEPLIRLLIYLTQRLCTLRRSANSMASSSWNALSKIVCRSVCKKMNNWAHRIRRTMVSSAAEGLPRGGTHPCLLYSTCSLLPAYVVTLPVTSPLHHYLSGVL